MHSLNARQAVPSSALAATGALELALANALSDFCEGGEGDRVYAQDHRDAGYAAAVSAMRFPHDDRWGLIEAAVDEAGPSAGPIVYAAAELRLAELEAVERVSLYVSAVAA